MQTLMRFFPHVAIAAWLVGLASAPTASPQMAEDRFVTVHAFWAYRPQTLQAARDLSTLVVVARVAAVEQGPDLVAPANRAATDASGPPSIPTQRIQVEVLDKIKGEPATTLTVFRTGSESWHVIGDPQYHPGETSLLFLVSRGDGSYFVLSPEGRYDVHDSRLGPVAEASSFALTLAGVALADTLAQLRPAK